MHNKTRWFLAGASLAGTLALGGCDVSPSSPYDAEYMKNLDVIVKFREVYGDKTNTLSWELDVDIPDNPPLEKWDDQHEMPQLMVKIKKHGDKVSGLYSMNLNGTDVRTLFTPEEIGGSIEAKGLSRPSRSPDGRFVITAYQPEAFQYRCAIFDLKTRDRQSLGPGRCMGFDWQPDSQAVYFVGGKRWRQPYRYDVTTAIAEPLFPQKEMTWVNCTMTRTLSAVRSRPTESTIFDNFTLRLCREPRRGRARGI